MKGRGESIGWTLAFEFAPALIFGGATAFAASKVLGLPQADPTPLGSGFGAFCGVWLLLRLFRGKSDDYAIPKFDLGAFDRELVAATEAAIELSELAETDPANQRPEGGAPEESDPAEDELVLDDVLAAIDPAARVVSLFRANDTAGELHARIERHLREAPRPSEPPDATQELHEAIAALRRSLR